MPSPTIIATPLIERAATALKNPPMLQPKARFAPSPIRRPPTPPFNSSPKGATLIANSRPRRAAANAPMSKPRFKIEPE